MEIFTYEGASMIKKKKRSVILQIIANVQFCQRKLHCKTKDQMNSIHMVKCQNTSGNVNQLQPNRQQCHTHYKYREKRKQHAWTVPSKAQDK